MTKIILQRDYKDCGVACLLYLITHYHGYVPYNKLKEETKTSDYGVTAYDLVKTLKKYHFDAVGKRVEYSYLQSLTIPVIVHLHLSNGLEHFAILEKIKKDKVYLMDPALGKRVITKIEFLKIFNNVIIECYPISPIPKLPKEKNPSKPFFNILFKYRKIIAIILITELLLTLTTVFTSLYKRLGFEYQKYPFLSLSLIVLLSYFIKSILDIGNNYLKLKVKEQVHISYLNKFLCHLLRIPLRVITSYKDGEILNRILEAEKIKDLFLDLLFAGFIQVLFLVFAIIIILNINMHCFIFISLGVLIYLLLSVVLSQKYYKNMLEHFEIDSNWESSILETIHLLPSIKHFNLEEKECNDIYNNLKNTVNAKTKINKKLVLYGLILSHYFDYLLFLLDFVSLWFYLQSQFTLYDFLTFQSISVFFLMPFKEFGTSLPKIFYLKSILEKINELTLLKEEKSLEGKSQAITKIKGENITFSYYNQVVLKNLSFAYNVGFIYVYGASGSGKSTFCKILCQEITDYDGKLYLNGVDYTKLKLNDIRKNIVYLSQDEQLYSKTIMANILLDSPLDTERLNKVCNICRVNEITDKLVFGLNTVVNNSSFSGGEKNRIILARTIYQERSMYLLDEPLSAVSTEMEKDIIKDLKIFLQNKMVFYISHRNLKGLIDNTLVIDNPLKGGDEHDYEC